jgi:hypothetical protein
LDNKSEARGEKMIDRRKILRETPLYSIHLSIIKKWKTDRFEHYISITEQVRKIEKPAKSGLFNKDLQSLVSKLEILRSFSVPTPDIMLAEPVAEAILNEQETLGSEAENINHELMHIVNLHQVCCIEIE